MRLKKGLIIIGIFIGIIIGLNIFESIISSNNSKKSELRAEEHRNNIMRFPVDIKSGKYIMFDYSDEYYIFDESLERFNESLKEIYLEDISTKYSEYIITRQTSYLAIKINDEIKFIEHEVPINKDYIKILRNLLEEEGGWAINIFPFNDGEYALINPAGRQFSFDIKNSTKLIGFGGKYESPSINVLNDTLEASGDLSATTYVFDKKGELLEEKEPNRGFLIENKGLIQISSGILILIVLRRIVKFNISDKYEVRCINIMITIIEVPLIILLLIGILLFVTFM